MENVLLDRSSSRSLEFPKRSLARSRRGPASSRSAVPPGGGSYSSFPTYHQPPYNQLHKASGGAWTSAPALPYAPMMYSSYSSPSSSLPLLPSNQPPLLPLPFPPTATKFATFPGLPTATPPPARAAATTVSAAAPAPPPRQRQDRRRRPARPPPPPPPATAMERPKKKPLERATPLPAAPVVTEALDDLEQEVARNFVEDLLHVLAPPPSSLPLPRFSLVVKASTAKDTATRVVAPAAPPSCNVEAATADGIRGLLRL